MSILRDTRCNVINAQRIVSPVGIFANIELKLQKLSRRIVAVSKAIDPVHKASVTLEVSDRNMKAFVVSQQVASEKFNYQAPTPQVYDTRVYIKNGISYYPWLFSKTLKHDDNGLCRKDDLDRLISYLTIHGDIDSVKNSQDSKSTRRLEGLDSGSSFWIKGVDTQHFDMSSEVLACDSAKNICEMIEVYEKSLCRDISFYEIQQGAHPSIVRALKVLNRYNEIGAYTGPTDANTGAITAKELFRGVGRDETTGPYVSQFLVLPFKYNTFHIDQKHNVEGDAENSVVEETYLGIQRGIVNPPPDYTNIHQYLYNGRVGGSAVHNDPMYFYFYNCSLILLQNGFRIQNYGNGVSTSWTDQGPPDGLAAIADVCLGALRVAWNTKYNKCLKLRPEAMAHRVDKILSGEFNGSVFDTIYDHLSHGTETLEAVKANNQSNNHLLLLQYPEGSPTHPSFVAGHAIVAGAAVTVTKAFIETHDDKHNPVLWHMSPLHSIDGDSLVAYNEADAKNMTITGELNKLASNISLCRDWAGVHYRADADKGIILGERFAISYLQTKLKEYISDQPRTFRLEKFNGEYIEISPTNVAVLKSR